MALSQSLLPVRLQHVRSLLLRQMVVLPRWSTPTASSPLWLHNRMIWWFLTLGMYMCVVGLCFSIVPTMLERNQRVRAVFANTSLISSLITADARMEKQWWFPSIRLLSLCRLHPMVQSLRFRRLFFLLLLRCVIMMQVLVASSLCYDGVRSAEVVSTLSSTAIKLIEIANRLADVVTSAAMWMTVRSLPIHPEELLHTPTRKLMYCSLIRCSCWMCDTVMIIR